MAKRGVLTRLDALEAQLREAGGRSDQGRPDARERLLAMLEGLARRHVEAVAAGLAPGGPGGEALRLALLIFGPTSDTKSRAHAVAALKARAAARRGQHVKGD